MKKSLFIVLSSILACSVLYFIEQSVGVSYILKTSLKLLLFIGIPFLYYKFFSNENFKNLLNYKKHTFKEFKLGLLLGAASFIIILLAFIFLKRYIDFDFILTELQEKLKISASIFIFIGFYITFINSLLEEFFFRGFIFISLFNLGYKKSGYIVSSLLFGLYHMAIFKTWFSLPLTFLAVFSLVAISFLFNYINSESKTIFNSWIIHILADAAIIIIGINLFFYRSY